MNQTSAHSLESLVSAGQLRLAFGRLPLVSAYSLSVSLLFTLLLTRVFPPEALWPGLAGIYVVTGLRFATWLAYGRVDPPPEESRRWRMVFMGGAAVAAAAWSAWVYPILVVARPTESAMLLITLMAVSAVAVSSLAPHFPSLLVFLCVALGPTTLFLFRGPDLISRITGGAILAGVATLVGAGWRMQSDIRRLLRTEIELSIAIDDAQDARRRAEEANEAKSMFLANMSHEVRTPINGILGMTELLMAHDLQPDQRRRVGLLQTSGENLLNVVNDILDYSKIEAGMLVIEEVRFDVRDTVRDVVDFLKQSAEAKGLAVNCVVDDAVPRAATGDPTRIRQVLTNLGTNAIKFTEAGRVAVRVERASDDMDGPMIRFTVSDTGIGISPQVQERLFLPFTQADLSTTRKYGGTGLGLSICRQLVTLMNGTIGVRSEEGRGSSFSFELPIANTSAVRREAAIG